MGTDKQQSREEKGKKNEHLSYREEERRNADTDKLQGKNTKITGRG